jgi:hypothetical protein
LPYLPTINSFPLNTRSVELDAPFHFLTSFVRLFLLYLKLQTLKGDDGNNLVKQFLNEPYLVSYFKLFIKNNDQSMNSSFILMKYENYFVYYCCKLAGVQFQVIFCCKKNFFLQFFKRFCC